METRWVVVANSSKALIYSANHIRAVHSLKLLKKFTHPDSRKKTQDLVSDRPGHYQTSQPARGAYESPTDPKEVEIDRFAQELATFLKEQKSLGNYETLDVIAAPHFSGLLRKHLNGSLHHEIERFVAKDLVNEDESELKQKIHDNLWG